MSREREAGRGVELAACGVGLCPPPLAGRGDGSRDEVRGAAPAVGTQGPRDWLPCRRGTQAARPIVLVGEVGKCRIAGQLRRLGWGQMFVKRTPCGDPWGFDNGAFVAWKHNEPWDESAFLRRFERAYSVGVPLLAVLPDRVADPNSLDFSLGWLERLPPWPWYLALQDGMTAKEVEGIVPRVAGLFLGGTDAFKATAPAWARLAHAAGRRFHYARCSTLRRLQAAIDVGADSVDTSHILWHKHRFAQYERWWRHGDPQERLPLW